MTNFNYIIYHIIKTFREIKQNYRINDFKKQNEFASSVVKDLTTVRKINCNFFIYFTNNY